MMRLTQAQSSTGQLSASITLPSHLLSPPLNDHHETFLALCRHRPTAKLKADVADRVLHPAECNITDKGGKESSAIDTLLRLHHHARWQVRAPAWTSGVGYGALVSNTMRPYSARTPSTTRFCTI
jgi:hypothetical protein